jgi:hypothetical protein
MTLNAIADPLDAGLPLKRQHVIDCDSRAMFVRANWLSRSR